jgi:hypothetical protein
MDYRMIRFFWGLLDATEKRRNLATPLSFSLESGHAVGAEHAGSE